MFSDLNSFMPLSPLHGDAWVHDPENAWPGASNDVIVTTVFLGPDILVQIGRDLMEVGNGQWSRFRRMSLASASQDEEWSDWQAFNAPAPPPTLVSISPAAHVNSQTGWTLTVTGTDFDPSMKIVVNGVERTTTFVDAAHISTAIGARELVSGAHTVAVKFGAAATPTRPLTVSPEPISQNFKRWIDPSVASLVTGNPVSQIRSPLAGALAAPSRFVQSVAASRPSVASGRLTFDGTADNMNGGSGYTFLSAATPADPAYAEAGKGPTTCGLAHAPDGTWWLSHYGKKHQSTATSETFHGSLCQYAKNLDGSPNVSVLLREIRFVEDLALANVGAQGIAFDAQDPNILWVADAQNGRIYGVNITTKVVASNFAFAGANGLAYYPSTNRLLVWTDLSNTVTLINKATGATISTHTLRDFDSNDGLFFDASYGSSGALYSSGHGNGRPGRFIKYDWNAGNPIPIESWFIDEIQAVEHFVVENGIITACDDEWYHAQPAATNRVVRFAIDPSSPDYGTTLVLAFALKIAATPAGTVSAFWGGDPINRKGIGIFFTTTPNQFRLSFRAGSTQATIDWLLTSTTTEFIGYLKIDAVTGDARLYVGGTFVAATTALPSALITGSMPQLVWTLGASYETAGVPARFAAVTIGAFVVGVDGTHQDDIEGLMAWGRDGTAGRQALLRSDHPYRNVRPDVS